MNTEINTDPKKIWSMRPMPTEKREPSIGTIARGFVFSKDQPLPHSGSEFVSYEDINPPKN